MRNYPTLHPSTLWNCHLEQINMVTYIFLFYVCYTLANILVEFGEILLGKILVNLKKHPLEWKD